MRFYRLRRELCLACLALSLLIVGEACAKSLDDSIFDAIHSEDRGDLERTPLLWINELGNSEHIIGGVLVAVLLGERRSKEDGVLVGAGFALSMGVAEGLKRTIRRPRPLNPEDTRSMPSGHATTAFSVATVLSHRYPKYRVVFYGLAVGVGYARVYFGRHYPSDVLAGAAIGIVMPRIVLRYETDILSIAF